MVRVRGEVDLAIVTSTGPIRPRNEDDFLVYEPADETRFARDGRLVAIADGIGGNEGGAEASRLALRGLLVGWLDAASEPDPQRRLVEAFARAQRAVAEEARREPRLSRMATTLLAVVQRGDRIDGISVGDSRCLLVGRGFASWLGPVHATEDGRLTHAVGLTDVVPETFGASFGKGDTLVLVSDGIWRQVSKERIARLVRTSDLERALARLVAIAVEHGGEDNMTAVVLRRRVRPRPGSRAIEPVLPRPAHLGSSPGVLARHWPWLLLVLGGGLALAALL